MAALLGGDSFLRAECIPFQKLSGLGDACGKNFLSLADREPNPFSLNLDTLPSLGSLTHPLVLENLAAFSQSPLNEKHTVSRGWLDTGRYEMHQHPLYLGFLVLFFPPEML